MHNLQLNLKAHTASLFSKLSLAC